MNKGKDIDDLMAKWLEGSLSDQEKSILENSKEFKGHKTIIDSTHSLNVPTMDEELVFSKIQNKIDQKKNDNKKAAKLIPLRRAISAVAAIAILLLAFVFLFPNTQNIKTHIGQQLSHDLPDGSNVKLNGNSSVKYESNFASERHLNLKGEAFFDVKEGNQFKVQTEIGAIYVLGTSFNVFARDNILVVSCKSGRVQVESGDNSIVLSKGEGIRIENYKSQGKVIQNPKNIGKWTSGETHFSRAQLEEVILSLKGTYPISIELPEEYKSRRFTGSFVHYDVNKALKMVFSPMGIAYQLDNQNKVIF